MYALLGILDVVGNQMELPGISYSIPLVDLYWAMIRSHTDHHQNLDFLGNACGLERPHGIPSWMPRWHSGGGKGHEETAIQRLELVPHVIYRATASTRSVGLTLASCRSGLQDFPTE